MYMCQCMYTGMMSLYFLKEIKMSREFLPSGQYIV